LNTSLSIISLHIFELLFDCLISYLYMCVLKLTLGKIIFLQIFSLCSVSSVKRPDEPVLESGCLRLCQSMIWQYAVWMSVYQVRTQALCFLCHSHSTGFFSYFCHVVCFSRGFLPRFYHSLYIISHSMIFFVSSFVLLSFCAF